MFFLLVLHYVQSFNREVRLRRAPCSVHVFMFFSCFWRIEHANIFSVSLVPFFFLPSLLFLFFILYPLFNTLIQCYDCTHRSSACHTLLSIMCREYRSYLYGKQHGFRSTVCVCQCVQLHCSNIYVCLLDANRRDYAPFCRIHI